MYQYFIFFSFSRSYVICVFDIVFIEHMHISVLQLSIFCLNYISTQRLWHMCFQIFLYKTHAYICTPANDQSVTSLFVTKTPLRILVTITRLRDGRWKWNTSQRDPQERSFETGWYFFFNFFQKCFITVLLIRKVWLSV